MYDDYFAEQTVPMGSLEVGHDKKSVVVGGVLSTIRSIVTKNGSKMAFLRVEDKSGDGEVIIFPKLFETIGEQLIQDAVVKVAGKVSSTDRQGNSLGEPKVIADEVTFVTNEELDNYTSSGKKMKTPKAKQATTKEAPTLEPSNVMYVPIDDTPKKLFVHVKDPDDHDSLLTLKKTLNEFPGDNEIILVLGADKKSALRTSVSY